MQKVFAPARIRADQPRACWRWRFVCDRRATRIGIAVAFDAKTVLFGGWAFYSRAQ
jgi:hypothetical protein